MNDVIEGEVVDPGKRIICEPGRAAATRAQMDQRGEFGGLVRESSTCPQGQILVIDMDRIEADHQASLDRLREELFPRHAPTSYWPLDTLGIRTLFRVGAL